MDHVIAAGPILRGHAGHECSTASEFGVLELACYACGNELLAKTKLGTDEHNLLAAHAGHYALFCDGTEVLCAADGVVVARV